MDGEKEELQKMQPTGNKIVNVQRPNIFLFFYKPAVDSSLFWAAADYLQPLQERC